jgi:hypothetical protein
MFQAMRELVTQYALASGMNACSQPQKRKLAV